MQVRSQISAHVFTIKVSCFSVYIFCQFLKLEEPANYWSALGFNGDAVCKHRLELKSI